MKEVLDKRVEELETEMEKLRNKVKKETSKEVFDAKKVITLCMEIENIKASIFNLYLVKGRA